MEIPSHRACAHCRSQKVRCLPDDSNPDVCQRCARSGRSCVFTPLQKRKQRKRTDTRVAELEREMRSMRAMLKTKESSASNSSAASPTLGGMESDHNKHEKPATTTVSSLWYKDRDWGSGLDQSKTVRMLTSQGPGDAGADVNEEPTLAHAPTTLWPEILPEKPPQLEEDVVDRGIVSLATARHLFETYKNDLYPNYPMVYIPEKVVADELRITKPTLFLAVIAAAAMKEEPTLSTTLDREVLQAYAQRSLVNSEKSLELVQALLISAFWYHPPRRYGQLKYYEYIHMASTMALDLLIGERPSHRKRNLHKQNLANAQHPAEDARNPSLSMSDRVGIPSEPETATIEARRTFLACYIICGGVSISLRRPRLLRVNSWLRDCVEYLDTSPNAVPLDRRLTHWARLMFITEEISNIFCYDDPGGMASIYELRTQLMYKDLERKLSDWERSVPDTDFSLSLRILYYTVRLYLDEIALHIDHDPDDFKAPYQMSTIFPHSRANDELPTQPLVEAISDTITSAHRLMDSFMQMEPEMARAMPVFTYIRVSLAAFVLAKLCLSAIHPDSRIAKILDRSAIKADHYVDRCILFTRNVVGPKKCRIPAIFLALLFKLRQWCTHPELIDQFEETEHDAMDKTFFNTAKAMAREDTEQSVRQCIVERGSSIDESPGSHGELHSSQQDSLSQASAATNSPREGQTFNFASGSERLDGYTSQPTSSVPMTSGSQAAPNMMGGASVDNMQPNLAAFNSSTLLQDQMVIDSSFFDIFNDPNAFAEGGLTGLDDWVPQPEDMKQLGPQAPYIWSAYNMS